MTNDGNDACPHGADPVDCQACQARRLAEHRDAERRRRARRAIIVLAALAAPPAADRDPLAGPFGADVADLVRRSPPATIAALREQFKDNAEALRVIDAALAGRERP